MEGTDMKSMTIYDSMIPAARVADSIFGNENPFEILDRFLSDDFCFSPALRSPVVDVSEEDKRYLIEAELPGLSEGDLKLEIKDGVLELSAAKEEKKDEQEGKKWIRRERSEFTFSRRFELPKDADAENIQASFKDGLLSIELPKKPDAAPRSIQVKIA
jgi:HSP20 family protein